MNHLDKLRRAKAHLGELDRLTDWYFDESGAFWIEPHSDPQHRWHSFVAHVEQQPGPDIGLAIGDCLHNLRASLDHAVWHLADAAVRGRKTEFPIFLNSGEFYETTEKGAPTYRSGLRKITGVPDAPRTLIEDAQPFDTPNHPLWVLQELENFDKHRVTHTTVGAIDEVNIEVPNLGQGIMAGDTKVGPVTDGAEVLVLAFSRPEDNPTVDMSVNFRWGVFADAEALGAPWEPHQLLAGIVSAVENVIDQLAPHFP